MSDKKTIESSELQSQSQPHSQSKTEQDTQQEHELKYFKINTTSLKKLIKDELKATSQGTAFLGSHKKEDIIGYIQNPIASEKILRQISNLLYNLSPQYKRLIHYFSDMARYDHIININNKRVMNMNSNLALEKYLKTCKYVDTMNIKHEFDKITKCVFREDVFYGYDYSSEHSFMIQKLNPDNCRISGIADGTFVFEFDFAYFKGRNNSKLNTQYGEEFREKYDIYENDKTKRWQELNLDRSICIKLSEDVDYPIPFFVGMFPDIFDLQDYKLLKKAREELQNYVVLVAKIPYKKNKEGDRANDFALTLDSAIEFGNKANESLPDQAGFILSPYEDVDAIHLGNKQSDNNSVAEAEEVVWDSAGVNKAIFNSSKISEESIRKSIVADENIVFGMYRQYERWLNRKLKLNINDDFKVRILNSTSYNYGEFYKHLKESASYGMPFKREVSAVLGQSPYEMNMSIHLENDILNLSDRLEPLQSSNTLSPDKKDPNRPEREIDGGSNGEGQEKQEE